MISKYFPFRLIDDEKEKGRFIWKAQPLFCRPERYDILRMILG